MLVISFFLASLPSLGALSDFVDGFFLGDKGCRIHTKPHNPPLHSALTPETRILSEVCCILIFNGQGVFRESPDQTGRRRGALS